MGWLPPSCVPYHYFENNSSPRGRGKQAIASLLMTNPRLIPAWTGKTRTRRAGSLITAAHPRVDGENAQHAPARASRYGLIPARAGKTMSQGPRSSVGTAHPRAGGKNFGRQVTLVALVGSSPRGRGKRLRRRTTILRVRLIPAWTGKTSEPPASPEANAAHPRMDGENESAPGRSVWLMGSSPRGRGKRVMGNDLLNWGDSSPRGRGKRSLAGDLDEHVRLIPARAGKTA